MENEFKTQECFTVFTGSRNGTLPDYARAATQLGHAFARHKIQLIYGGGYNGLMGRVATECAREGGDVHGIIPGAFLKGEMPRPEKHERPLATQVGESGIQMLSSGGTMRETVVRSMHERKTLMDQLSDGFVALPGGYGTLEEVAEMTTWTQLGIHKKPVVLLNVANFYDPLRAFIDGAVKSGFISDECRAFLTFVDKPVNVAECEFDWGEAALEALHVWTRQGAGGGIPYGLDWS